MIDRKDAAFLFWHLLQQAAEQQGPQGLFKPVLLPVSWAIGPNAMALAAVSPSLWAVLKLDVPEPSEEVG